MAADVLDGREGREVGDCRNAWTPGCSVVQVPLLRTPRETRQGNKRGAKDEQRAFRAKAPSSCARLPRGSYRVRIEESRAGSGGNLVGHPRRSEEVGKRGDWPCSSRGLG